MCLVSDYIFHHYTFGQISREAGTLITADAAPYVRLTRLMSLILCSSLFPLCQNMLHSQLQPDLKDLSSSIIGITGEVSGKTGVDSR